MKVVMKRPNSLAGQLAITLIIKRSNWIYIRYLQECIEQLLDGGVN